MRDVEVLPAFRQFLAAVARLKASPDGNGQQLTSFREFLAAAAGLKSASLDNALQLAAFLKEAGRTIIVPLRGQWEALQPKLATLRPWFTDCPLLREVMSVEDSYTELLAWALRPATHRQTAEVRQRAWLASLGIDWRGTSHAEPKTWLQTEHGVPDLVLQYGTQTVVVEVKTESAEHLVGSGGYQTLDYPDEVRKALDLGSGHHVHMVFLTPDGREAANPDAKCTSFAEFALVMAKTLEHVDLAGDIRTAFNMLITEFATYPPSPIREALGWGEHLINAELANRKREITVAAKILAGGNYV